MLFFSSHRERPILETFRTKQPIISFFRHRCLLQFCIESCYGAMVHSTAVSIMYRTIKKDRWVVDLFSFYKQIESIDQVT